MNKLSHAIAGLVVAALIVIAISIAYSRLMERRVETFQHAKVVLLELGTRAIIGQASITDPDELQRLASYFPGISASTNIAGRWMHVVEIELTRADGSAVTVESNFTYWRAGNGHRPMDAGFEQYVHRLIAEDEDGAERLETNSVE